MSVEIQTYVVKKSWKLFKIRVLVRVVWPEIKYEQ
jgi:hypothetical protein